MIKIDGITYRNLQEQVEKNKADIEDLKDVEAQASIGIVVVGELTSEDNLPDATTYEGNYGDAYLISPDGAEQYLMIFTRPTNETTENHWVRLNVETVGPQGPAGDTIESIGNIEYTEDKMDTETVTTNTIKVTLSDGSVKTFKVLAYAQRGEKGEQGIQGVQGVKGDKGEKGDKGDTGAQGEIGPTAPAYHIIGIVTSTSGLPLPTTLKDLTGAYLVGDPQHLYCQVGKTLEEAIWTDLGELNLNVWEINSEGTVSPIEAAKLVQCNNLTVLGDTHLTSPNISGVVNTSAIASSDVLTLKGTNEVEIYQGDTKAIDITSDKIILSKNIAPNAAYYTIGEQYNRIFNIWADNARANLIDTVRLNLKGNVVISEDNKHVIGTADAMHKTIYSHNFADATSTFTPTEARNAIDKVTTLEKDLTSLTSKYNSLQSEYNLYVATHEALSNKYIAGAVDEISLNDTEGITFEKVVTYIGTNMTLFTFAKGTSKEYDNLNRITISSSNSDNTNIRIGIFNNSGEFTNIILEYQAGAEIVMRTTCNAGYMMKLTI
jgi:hypothetical protein